MKKIIALGDSYTIGEGVEIEKSFPHQLANALGAIGHIYAEPAIIAQTGWRTDQLIDRLASTRLAVPFDIVTLLIGVNNQYQNKNIDIYKKEFTQLLESSISLAGDVGQVIVMSIPDYSVTPFGRDNAVKIYTDINSYNEINKSISLSYDCIYVDITNISRKAMFEPSLLAFDGLHPSGDMYQMWVAEIMQKM